MNQEAGFDAASQLFTQGWALAVTLPDSQTRVARKSFIIKLFYTDGSSMQRLKWQRLTSNKEHNLCQWVLIQIQLHQQIRY